MTAIKSLFLPTILLFSTINLFSHKNNPHDYDMDARFPFTKEAIKEKKETATEKESVEEQQKREEKEAAEEKTRQLHALALLHQRKPGPSEGH